MVSHERGYGVPAEAIGHAGVIVHDKIYAHGQGTYLPKQPKTVCSTSRSLAALAA